MALTPNSSIDINSIQSTATTTANLDLDLDLDLNGTTFPFVNTSMTSPTLNVSEDERRRYLAELQEETTLLLTPAIIFLAILAVVGLFGNTMVLLVYSRKPRRSATDVFIMAIASFDLLTNCLAIPGEIYDAFHYWDFDQPIICKGRLFFNALTTITSAMILLAVAVSRYKKVCRPFGNQTSLKTSKRASIGIALFGLLCATPQTILNGSHTIITPRDNITGHECTTDDQYFGTMWPLIYYAFLTLLFLGVCIPLVVLYVLISIQAWRHSQRHGMSVLVKAPATSDGTATETLNSEDSHHRRPSKASRVFNFFKRDNQKYDISSGASTNEESLESDAALEMKNIKKGGKGNNRSGKDRESDDETPPPEADNQCTRRVSSPSNDVSKVAAPMMQELSRKLKKVSENEEGTDGNTSNEDETKETINQNKPSANDKTPEKELGNQSNEDSQVGNSDLGNEAESYFSKSMQWVDITYCIQDGNKSEDEIDGSNGSDTLKKKTRKKVSREESLRRRLADALTGAMRAKKESATEADDDKDVGIDHADVTTTTKEQLKPQKNGKSSNATPISKSQKAKTQPQRKLMTRTTFMLIIISAIFVIAFVPHLALISCKFLISNFLQNMSPVGYAFYNVFLRFYFLNSATNAMIYGLCDERFRKQMYRIICVCKK